MAPAYRGVNTERKTRLKEVDKEPQRPRRAVAGRTHDGRLARMFTVVDEYSRECVTIPVARRLNSDAVQQTLMRLVTKHGLPAYIPPKNGSEFTVRLARGLRKSPKS
mgnify:CR=1 FL=1